MTNKEIVWTAAIGLGIYLLTQIDTCNEEKHQTKLTLDEEVYQASANVSAITELKIINDSLVIYENVLIPTKAGELRDYIFQLNYIKKQITGEENKNETLRDSIRSKMDAINKFNIRIAELAQEIRIQAALKESIKTESKAGLEKIKREKEIELEKLKNEYTYARSKCPE